MQVHTHSRTPALWRYWHSIGAVYGVVAGVALVGVALSPDATGLLTRAVFALGPELPGRGTVAVQQAVAVTGALTAGWGAIAWGLRPGPAAEPAADRRSGRALTAGLLVWFALDSTVSVWMGAGLNVIGNLTLLIALLPPSVVLARTEPVTASGS